ncbi:MAG: BlaI/MecI/CopY family transcriptional regulator [Bacillota bacterium]|nr:MAG: BlaI/MecI/CopY family transcriptional regulator [Bacillota bacterium]
MSSDDLTFGFKPGGSGLTKVLGELEAEVMELVWRKGRATVRDVHEDLHRKRSLAYTTVMTTMSRLHDKGLLVREPESNYYVYAPALGRDEFMAKVAGQVLDGLLQDFAGPVLSHLVERVADIDRDTLDELERTIRRRRAEEIARAQHKAADGGQR